jgi:hypothetical protein
MPKRLREMQVAMLQKTMTVFRALRQPLERPKPTSSQAGKPSSVATISGLSRCYTADILLAATLSAEQLGLDSNLGRLTTLVFVAMSWVRRTG